MELKDMYSQKKISVLSFHSSALSYKRTLSLHAVRFRSSIYVV